MSEVLFGNNETERYENNYSVNLCKVVPRSYVTAGTTVTNKCWIIVEKERTSL